jgi:hypothetical protein
MIDSLASLAPILSATSLKRPRHATERGVSAPRRGLVLSLLPRITLDFLPAAFSGRFKSLA